MLPRTAEALEEWNRRGGCRGEAAYAALAADIAEARENRDLGKASARVNYVMPGARSLFSKTGRAAGDMSAPYKEALIGVDEDWGEPEVWRVMQREADPLTMTYYLQAIDMKYSPDGDDRQPCPSDMQIYQTLFWRTFVLSSALITGLTILLGFPIA
ncbi:MAG: hypothetical protein U5K43_01135 [Halofilum sp. (in: g-proteobacteria)]|nr:hypothetical protein [Halofilum sp. (in: g-proteobacteria)]